MVIEIYSKKDCIFCEKAKNVLRDKGLEFTEKSVDNENIKNELLERYPQVRTVPQIFIDNEHVGGYNELTKTNLNEG